MQDFEIKKRNTGEIIKVVKAVNFRLAVEQAVREKTDLGGANFRGADFSGADFRGANFRGADFSGANLSGANFSGANLGRTDFSGANLSDANLRDADFSGANFRGADFSGADLRGADFRGANFRGADFSGANLSGADLRGADFSGADLRGADFRGADLRGADFRGANFSGANFSGANLGRTDFSGANLGEATGVNKYLTTGLYILKAQPGRIRAYKLVTADGVGPYSGGIKYEVGRKYEVLNANTDEFLQCAEGINLATLDWCIKEWKKGYKILLVEFEALDIAAIPVASDGKFRVFRCEVISEVDLKEIGVEEEVMQP